MTYAEKYRYWEMLSDYDLESERLLLSAGRWMHVASIGYNAVLRLLKGILVYYTHKEAPKSDNILFLLNRLAENTDFFSSEAGARFTKEKEVYLSKAIDLIYYHVNDYPFTYKKVLDRFIGQPAAELCDRNINDIIAWLKSFAPPSDEA